MWWRFCVDYQPFSYFSRKQYCTKRLDTSNSPSITRFFTHTSGSPSRGVGIRLQARRQNDFRIFRRHQARRLRGNVEHLRQPSALGGAGGCSLKVPPDVVFCVWWLLLKKKKNPAHLVGGFLPAAVAFWTSQGHWCRPFPPSTLDIFLNSLSHIYTSWFKHKTPNFVSHECRMQ